MNELTTQRLPATGKDNRRSVRYPVSLAIEAKWQEANGKIIQEAAKVLEVNAQGGLLEMRTYPRVGSEMQLINLISNEAAQARVVAVRRSKAGEVLGIAVELLDSGETFWGLNFQVKKTSAELAKLEQAIRSGGIDPRILMEFRDAVDYVRKTAWAVQEWQERKQQKHDTQTLLPLLTSERIRRAAQLNNAIATDLETHDVDRETLGLDELFNAVQRVYQHLAKLFKDHQA